MAHDAKGASTGPEEIIALLVAGQPPDDEEIIQCIRGLADALRWTEHNFRLAVQGKPVRDMAENLAFNEAVSGGR